MRGSAFSGLAALVLSPPAAATIFPSDIINSGDYVGYWADAPGWEVYEYRNAEVGFCTIYSTPTETPFGSYQVAMTFGSINEFALVTSAPVQGGKEATIDFDQSGGFDWYDIVPHKIERPEVNQLTYWYGNTMTSGMLQKLIAAMRHDRSATITFAGGKFSISLAGFAAAYADMKRCENHRVGHVLENDETTELQ